MTVTPSQFDALWQLMNVAELRHRVISQNVANVNTPGYLRMEVSFEEELARAAKSGDLADIADVSAKVEVDYDARRRADGNSVDIDKEMGQLSKNTLLYQTYAQVLASKIATMQSAIRGE